MSTRRLLLAAGLLVAIAVCSPASAMADPSIKLAFSFEPERLGASTTVGMDFQIHTPQGERPLALTGLDLRLPSGMITGSSTLGLATCDRAMLERHGLGVCPAKSLMGRGSATVGVPLGSEVIAEAVRMTIVMAPSVSGHTEMYFYATGASPVIAQLVFPGILLGDTGPFGARLNTSIPLIPGLPGGPGATLLGMHASLGPEGITYYRREHGNMIPYSPEGFLVPSRCPTGGFPFAAVFTFENGLVKSLTSRTPCPPRAAAIAHRSDRHRA